MLRSTITTALEVTGAALVALGAFAVWQPLGFVVTGIAAIIAGYLAGAE